MRKNLPAELTLQVEERPPTPPVLPAERKPLRALPVDDLPAAPNTPVEPIVPVAEDDGPKPLRALPVD